MWEVRNVGKRIVGAAAKGKLKTFFGATKKAIQLKQVSLSTLHSSHKGKQVPLILLSTVQPCDSIEDPLSRENGCNLNSIHYLHFFDSQGWHEDQRTQRTYFHDCTSTTLYHNILLHLPCIIIYNLHTTHYWGIKGVFHLGEYGELLIPPGYAKKQITAICKYEICFVEQFGGISRLPVLQHRSTPLIFI